MSVATLKHLRLLEVILLQLSLLHSPDRASFPIKAVFRLGQLSLHYKQYKIVVGLCQLPAYLP